MSGYVVQTDTSDDSTLASGVKSPEHEHAAKKFRTFTVQGYELKDFEIKLERLSQKYILNAINNGLSTSSNLDYHEGEHWTDNEDILDDESWKDENSSEISSEDDYQPTSNNPNKQKQKTVRSSVREKEIETATNRDDGDKVCPQSKQLRCEVCGKLYTNFKAWRCHKLRHIKNKICSHCGKAFSFNWDLRDHERSHRTADQIRNLACEPCSVDFDSRDAFLKHRSQEHSADGNVDEDKLQCLICVKVFNSRTYLRTHMNLHGDKNHSCEICGSSFNTRPKLRVHMKRSHSRDKVCAQCGKAFAFNCELRDHQRVHSKDRRSTLFCKSCDLSFDSWTAIVEHRKKEHPEEGNAGDEKHKCHICEKILRSSQALRAHMESHQKGNHPCEVCGLSFSGTLRLKSHIKCHEKNKKCELCGKSFTFDSQLRIHLERVHISQDEREKLRARNVCGTCGKRFLHASILEKHMKVNHAISSDKVSHTCDFCGIILASRVRLLQHVRHYHKEKKHVCETCGKRFVETRALKQHLSTHTKEKPFTCELCGKGVISLKLHQIGCLEKRRSTEEKKFKCSQCDKAFHLEVSLKSHERIHLSPDRFECEVCHKKFRLNCFLVQHRRRSHFPEESIPCSMCSARFKLQCDLKWHMEYDHLGNRERCAICGYEAKSRYLFKRHELKHRVGKRFECDVCGKKFFQSDHLKRHRQTHEKKSKKAAQVN